MSNDDGDRKKYNLQVLNEITSNLIQRCLDSITWRHVQFFAFGIVEKMFEIVWP